MLYYILVTDAWRVRQGLLERQRDVGRPESADKRRRRTRLRIQRGIGRVCRLPMDQN